MSNKKLYLILKGYRAQLVAAIEEAERQMPEAVEQRTYRKHTVSHGPEPPSGTLFATTNKQISEVFCKDESHFTDEPDGYVHLQPLYDMLAELDSDLEMLKSDEEEKEAKRA
jgi:hypothetical protein